MTLNEAIATQPAWVEIWVTWLGFGAFVLPLALLIWKQSRIPAIVTVVASVLAGVGVMWLFEQMGYVRLLGLPHLIFWLPLSWYLYRQMNREDMPVWPKRIMAIVLVTIAISLAFDIVDVARYALGDRAPYAG